MKDILNQNKLLNPPKFGEIVKGQIIGITRSGLYLNLEPFGTGIIYGKELAEIKDYLKDLKTGDTIFAKIIDLENEAGYTELSFAKASKELAWKELQQKKDEDEILTIKILGANKGGLLAEISGISAFLPTSQLSLENYPRVEKGDSQEILKELQKLIGKEIKVKILDIEAKEKKIILSEKATESEKIKKILKNYKIGDIVEGEITGLTNFGAFIKIPELLNSDSAKNSVKKIVGVEGLIHISELDWQVIKEPSEIVKIGQKIKVKIVEISNDRIFLSLKALKKNPWENIEKKYKKGDIIKGRVFKFSQFGAFVLVSPKIQGLCHISELKSQKKMKEILEIDKKYNFEILLIDEKKHRLNLKLVNNSVTHKSSRE